ncbi:MAG: hypothetical protein KAG84_02840 [Bacteroidales bacterium]|nr:hypothetical protein [Bacteroidales bacterium]
MKKTLLIIAISLFSFIQIQAQNGVAFNTTGTAPDASAIIDATSTSQGILIPRMTMAQRDVISNPATGLMIYQNDNTPGFYHYDGANWVSNGSTAAIGINDLTDGKASGNSYYIGFNSGTSNTGTYNVAMGYESMKVATNALGNIAIGSECLKALTTGNLNIAIGFNTGTSTTTGQKNILIGDALTTTSATANNELNIGDVIFGTDIYNSNARVGIGSNVYTPTSTLDVDGSVSMAISIKTSDYTLTDDDYTILYHHTSGTPTLTLPTAVGHMGRIYMIRTNNFSNNEHVIINTAGGNIEGATSINIGDSHDFQAITVQSTGTNWWIISGTKL